MSILGIRNVQYKVFGKDRRKNDPVRFRGRERRIEMRKKNAVDRIIQLLDDQLHDRKAM